MNKIFKSLLIITSFFMATMCSAQVQISTNLLDNTQWVIASRKIMGKIEKANRVNIWKFNKSSYSTNYYATSLNEIIVLKHPYYISNVEPCDYSFDKNKVGVNTEGKYLVFYNEKCDEVDYYTVMSFTDEEMVLFHKNKVDYIPDVYITFKRAHKGSVPLCLPYDSANARLY